ncbi:hypothetical protein SynA1560_02960 [Synechococcus sp. A15-60]|nr:hypothetical protein SynA1560_02960 [Synechococcus sp. A15-60]
MVGCSFYSPNSFSYITGKIRVNAWLLCFAVASRRWLRMPSLTSGLLRKCNSRS